MNERREEQSEDSDEDESGKEGVERGEDFRGIIRERIAGSHPAEDHRGVEQRIDPAEAGDDVIAEHARAQRDRTGEDRVAEVADHPPREFDAREEAISAVFVHPPELEHAGDYN